MIKYIRSWIYTPCDAIQDIRSLIGAYKAIKGYGSAFEQ